MKQNPGVRVSPINRGIAKLLLGAGLAVYLAA
jgi:hypothetical protein